MHGKSPNYHEDLWALASLLAHSRDPDIEEKVLGWINIPQTPEPVIPMLQEFLKDYRPNSAPLKPGVTDPWVQRVHLQEMNTQYIAASRLLRCRAHRRSTAGAGKDSDGGTWLSVCSDAVADAQADSVVATGFEVVALRTLQFAFLFVKPCAAVGTGSFDTFETGIRLFGRRGVCHPAALFQSTPPDVRG